jgi:TetR/AcrR family tetracycline transcriptional repressor
VVRAGRGGAAEDAPATVRRPVARSARGARRQHLTRQRVVAGALAVVDREGLDGLTMRTLGRELGVDPMAVYHWFPNKIAILQGVVEAILGEIPTSEPPVSTSWPAWVAEVAHGYRRVLLDHPNALPIVSTQPVLTPAGLRVVEMACRPLVAAGFRPTEALAVVNDVAALVIGSVLVQAGVTPGTEPVTRDQVSSAYLAVDASELPLVTRAMAEAAPGDFDSDLQFGSLLDAYVQGLVIRAGRSATG